MDTGVGLGSFTDCVNSLGGLGGPLAGLAPLPAPAGSSTRTMLGYSPAHTCQWGGMSVRDSGEAAGGVGAVRRAPGQETPNLKHLCAENLNGGLPAAAWACVHP
jgi:hypothetical protein